MTMVTIPQFRAIANDRVRNDYDVVVLVEGEEGVGKSTLAYLLANGSDPRFNPRRDIVFYDVGRFYKLYDAVPGRAILIDEAVALLFNRQAMTKVAKRLVEELMEGRYKRKILIFCIPDRLKIDDYIRDHRAKYWFYVKARGYADFHIAQKKKWRKRGDTGLNWVQHTGIRFPRLPKVTLKNYKEAKARAKMEYDERYPPTTSK